MPTPRALQHRILIPGVVILVAGFVAASNTLHGKSEEIFALAEGAISQYPLLGMLLFVLLAMISAMLAFFSSAVLVPIGVYTWGAAVCTLLLWIGWLLGGMVAFAIGRYLGRSVASRLIGESRFSAFERRFSRRLHLFHILLLQLTLPSEIPGYVLGALRYRFAYYLVSLAIAELPYAVGTVLLGTMYLQRNAALLLALGLAAVLVSIFAYRSCRNRSRR